MALFQFAQCVRTTGNESLRAEQSITPPQLESGCSCPDYPCSHAKCMMSTQYNHKLQTLLKIEENDDIFHIY